MTRFLGISLLLIGLVSLAAAEGPYRFPSETLRPWKLAFVRGDDIWVSNGDGTDQKLIIEKGQSPSWSPDRSRIAFVRDNNIWVASADGTKQRPVTSQWKKHDPHREPWFSDAGINISWRPTDGSLTFSHPEIFKVERVDGAAGIVPTENAARGLVVGRSIFDVRLNGTAPGKAIVRYDIFEDGTSFFLADHAYPAWAPSGKKLAFTRNGDIWIAEVKGNPGGDPPIGWEVKRLAAVASYDEPTYRASRANLGATRLSWRRNGRHLAYGYDRLQGSGFNEIHLLDTKNGKDTIIAKDALEPCFSPDGRYIVYWTYAEDLCGKGICIGAVTLDGKNRQKLVPNGKDPAW
jgi:dipeptidyl aminopeptidase/acylaminoacyl peptidase